VNSRKSKVTSGYQLWALFNINLGQPAPRTPSPSAPTSTTSEPAHPPSSEELSKGDAGRERLLFALKLFALNYCLPSTTVLLNYAYAMTMTTTMTVTIAMNELNLKLNLNCDYCSPSSCLPSSCSPSSTTVRPQSLFALNYCSPLSGVPQLLFSSTIPTL
jgi:hypothetical protein